ARRLLAEHVEDRVAEGDEGRRWDPVEGPRVADRGEPLGADALADLAALPLGIGAQALQRQLGVVSADGGRLVGHRASAPHHSGRAAGLLARFRACEAAQTADARSSPAAASAPTAADPGPAAPAC